jgi:hypothetical protein
MLKRTAWMGASVLVLGAALAASPLGIGDSGLDLAPAFAKDGRDGGNSGSGSGGGDDDGGSSGSGGGRGSDDSGGSGGRGSDDNGGSGGRGGDDDGGNSGRGGGDDDSSGHGRGRGGDDDGGDNRGGRGGDDDDRASRRGGRDTGGLGAPVPARPVDGARLRVVKVERGAGGMEVTYSNGVREEIEAGRYQRKDAAGRTVVERPATNADLRRIGVNIRNSGLALRPAPAGQVRSVEVGAGSIEVRYATGWKEELAAGRYELKDPNNNTVVERPATAADRQRMQALAGG